MGSLEQRHPMCRYGKSWILLQGQRYVSKSSVTYSATGRSPTQIAPSLRHSHRNASAMHCLHPELKARLGREESGNPPFPARAHACFRRQGPRREDHEGGTTQLCCTTTYSWPSGLHRCSSQLPTSVMFLQTSLKGNCFSKRLLQ